jgi:hypothetical protein
MSLVDFMQQLQEQDNLVYSEVPEPSIRVIPPEKTVTKIIPPESTVVKPPTTIKLKINQKSVTINNEVPNKVENTQGVSNNSILKTPPKVQETVQQSVQETKVQQTVQPQTYVEKQVQVEQPKKLSEEELFINTGTESSKMNIWLEYYHKAKSSRKSNQIVERMKMGRFTITPDNKVLLLPDYDIVGKDPDDVLKDKWF